MVDYLLMVSSQVGTMFLMMAAGFALARRGLLTREALPQLTNLLLTAVLPCMLVDSMQIERTPALLGAMGYGALLATGLYVLYCLLSTPLFRRQDPAPARCCASAPSTATWASWGCPWYRWCWGSRPWCTASST